MLPRLPDCDQLVDVRPWRPGLWKAIWRPDQSTVLVKAWSVPAGADPETRLQWQHDAASAMGDASPQVLWRQIDPITASSHGGDASHARQIGSVLRWLEGTAPTLPLATGLLRQLLTALQRLHEAGLVHRDICARNLLVTADGKLHVLDIDDVVARGEKADVVGTPLHMAPEVSAGGRPTASADLYAVGFMVDPHHLPIVAALTRTPHAPLRAGLASELLRMLPLPLGGAPRSRTLSGPSTLHRVPEQVADLRSSRSGRTALSLLDGVGWGQPRDDDGKALTPDDIHRWRALALGPQPVPLLRKRIAAGAPGQALWSMVDHPTTWHDDHVDTFGAAAFETYEAAAQRRARAVLQHSSAPAARFWGVLLSGALRMQQGEARAVFEEVSTLPAPDRPWARRAHEVSLMRAAFGVSPQRAQETFKTLPPASFDDPDAGPRRLAWSGLLDYRQGRYEPGRRQLQEAWRARPFVHTRGMTASNLLAILLHLDDPEQAEQIAREALEMLPPGAHPIAAARLATKMREAIYRGHAAPQPDTRLLDAILPGLPPVSASLAVLNEAAAAWRSGDRSLAARLAHEAARRFEACRFTPGALMAGALARRTGHPAWMGEGDRLEAAVDGLLDGKRGAYLPAIAAQVLGLLAGGPTDPRAQDAAQIAQGLHRPPDARREVMSLAECARGGPTL